MFAERFDALMNIAEVSNSLLGREINMNPSHIGRLRSGARPLPKKQNYLPVMCQYLVGRIQKEYQLNALQKLTGMDSDVLLSKKSMAQYLERWLAEGNPVIETATGRLISGFTRISSGPVYASADSTAEEMPQKCTAYLYGNAGKRKAVEQFFMMILREKTPRTLLLFSDENFAWLFEDAAFAARWTELFRKVILKGNRVRMIHTVSRNMNEMIEGITRWIPIYMTGAVEPYCYPRLRDGLFQRTMFIAPKTAAVISSSVQQDTEGMLNLFLTDKAAIDALEKEYERYIALCRPLMRIFTEREADGFIKTVGQLVTAGGNACLSFAMPPLFAMPEKMVKELAEQTGNKELIAMWKRSLSVFHKNIKNYRLSITLLNPEAALESLDSLPVVVAEGDSIRTLAYSKEQYFRHVERLLQLENRYDNLSVTMRSDVSANTLIYVKEGKGVVLAKINYPMSAFVISDQSMVRAFSDYFEKVMLA